MTLLLKQRDLGARKLFYAVQVAHVHKRQVEDGVTQHMPELIVEWVLRVVHRALGELLVREGAPIDDLAEVEMCIRDSRSTACSAPAQRWAITWMVSPCSASRRAMCRL